MTATLAIARDLLREAASRRWFLALGVVTTLALLFFGLSLRFEVIDGALAGTRLFGELLDTSIRSADVALRPVFVAVAYLIFYFGTAFMVLACADFAPKLLAPGRIEQLLALPVRRWHLIAGTYLGVLALAAAAALYGSGGLCVILGAKTGVWTARPIAAALLAVVSFAGIYALMLASAVFVRSASLSAGVGGLLFVGGIVAGYRAQIAPLFEAGLGRSAFLAATAPLPRVSALANASAALAGSEPLDLRSLVGLLAGLMVFGLGGLALGVWRFEQKDF